MQSLAALSLKPSSMMELMHKDYQKLGRRGLLMLPNPECIEFLEKKCFCCILHCLLICWPAKNFYTIVATCRGTCSPMALAPDVYAAVSVTKRKATVAEALVYDAWVSHVTGA
jgi:hypothetical protein